MPTAVFDRLESPVFPGVPLIDEATSNISTVIEDPNGVASEKVIRMSDPWQVRFNFSISGFVALLPAGSFDLEVDAEYLGNEVMCGTLTIPAAAGVLNLGTWMLEFKDQIVPVPAGTITQEGVYRITKHLRYTLPGPALKTAAFVESEEIEFY